MGVLIISQARFAALENAIAFLQAIINRMERHQMSVASDIKSRLDKLEASVSANTNATSSVAQAFSGVMTELATVKAEFDAYRSTHPDDADLAGIGDRLDAVIANVDADTIAEAAINGTPAAVPQ
jgi:hypothetical protein